MTSLYIELPKRSFKIRHFWVAYDMALMEISFFLFILSQIIVF